jgi:Tfp pilus assembly protein PilF
MHAFIRVGCLLLALALGGCAVKGPLETADLWADARFKPVAVPSAAEVLAPSPAMRRFLATEFPSYQRKHGSRDGLFYALRDQAGLQLLYDGSGTRTAAEAFDARAGNCLSLVLMTVALARELNLPVQINEVDVAPLWSRSDQFMTLSGHVNVSLDERWTQAARSRRMTIDFLPIDPELALRAQAISDARALAMFMNNRAVEALERGQTDAAYAHLRRALAIDPAYTNALNTLGTVYRARGEWGLAERSWQRLLSVAPDHVHAISNLELLLRTQHRLAEADGLVRRLAGLRDETPFVAYAQGVQAAQRGDWPAARTAFERELKLAPHFPELHLWLARTYLQLGDRVQADAALAQAQERATTPVQRQRYQAKLEALRSL